jgi:hypothetical protein
MVTREKERKRALKWGRWNEPSEAEHGDLWRRYWQKKKRKKKEDANIEGGEGVMDWGVAKGGFCDFEAPTLVGEVKSGEAAVVDLMMLNSQACGWWGRSKKKKDRV